MSISKSSAHRRRSEREQLAPFRAHPANLAPRDAQDLVAYPFFSRAKTNRIVPIDFCAGTIVIRVEAMRKHGMAAISDADVPIWAVRQIVEARDTGLKTSRLMAATRYEISTFVARDTSAREYGRLKTGLDRPQSMTVQTPIRQPTEWRPHRCSWINEWKETVDVNGRSFGLELILPDWFYTGVVDHRLVLTIRRTLFQPDRRNRPSPLLAHAQARWAPPRRLELPDLCGSPCQVRHSLAAQALGRRRLSDRPTPDIARLSACVHARSERYRAAELRTEAWWSLHGVPAHARSYSKFGEQSVNQLVLSRTATLVPSGTQSSCCRGPKLSLIVCFSALYERAHFTNLLTPTFYQQAGHACSDASCTCSPTRHAFLQCNSFLEPTDAVARSTARTPRSGSPYYTPCVPLRQLARRGELGDMRGWHQSHHMPESGEWAVRLTSAMLDGFKTACRYVADLEPERAQRVADRVHHIQQLAEQRRPPDPQRPQRLHALRPDVDCAEPAGPHHLRNIFGVVPVGRVQRRLGMARLDAKRGEAPLDERREQPCAVRERFQVDALEVDSSLCQDQLDCVRGRLKCRPPDELAVTIHRANVRRLQRGVRTWIEVRRSLSPSIDAARRALHSRIIARRRRRNAAGEGAQVSTPITRKCSGFRLADQTTTCMRRDWQRRGASPANLQECHACLTTLKAYGSQLDRWGAAA
ncbi:hypothetical protein ACVIHI_000527 [Bradyrhizobium sp. USDA 4524]